jgi:septum formation protein
LTASTQQPKIVLGSSSPRRKDLLSVLGLTYEVIKPETPELVRPGEAPVDYVKRNSMEKCEWVCGYLLKKNTVPNGGSIVICADTIVVLGSTILEKPLNPEHAIEMLKSLSGTSHTVVTGVRVQSVGTGKDRASAFVSTTKVKIKTLSEQEIKNYVQTGEPLDKAGAYGAQGIGSYMVEGIEGSYANVVGLPVSELVQCLEKDFSFSIWQS